MHDQLERRLAQLKSEFETGQARLRDLSQQQAHLQETLLRISGAIQVLEELMDEATSGDDGRVSTSEAEASR
ncbi:MAG TPA: hypothetical protein VFH48_41250 [Chloroflexota bacterium]|nr:hypothetical protein [Chloroflexota bacterium]